jgi:hypothetical protein
MRTIVNQEKTATMAINKEHPGYASLLQKEVELIVDLQRHRDFLEDSAKDSIGIARKLFPLWIANEYALQRLWGFPEDPKYHRSYYYPQCTCPKIDNEDMRGTPYRVYDASCPIHNMPEAHQHVKDGEHKECLA